MEELNTHVGVMNTHIRFQCEIAVLNPPHLSFIWLYNRCRLVTGGTCLLTGHFNSKSESNEIKQKLQMKQKQKEPNITKNGVTKNAQGNALNNVDNRVYHSLTCESKNRKDFITGIGLVKSVHITWSHVKLTNLFLDMPFGNQICIV